MEVIDRTKAVTQHFLEKSLFEMALQNMTE